MGYLEGFNWDVIKKDLQQGLGKSMALVKQSAAEVQKKAGELTDEGKRQYKILRLKARIHEAIADLGAKTYVLMSGAKKTAPNAEMKELVTRIQGLEAQIAILEGRSGEAHVKTRSKPRAGARKTKVK